MRVILMNVPGNLESE